MFFKSLFLFLPAIALVACTSSTPSRKISGEAIVGKYRVIWGPFRKTKENSGQTPLIFSFLPTGVPPSNGVTEGDWEKEAARLGTSVNTAKILHGNSVYKGPDGALRTCTISAIEDGFCGIKTNLSVSQKAEIAKNMLNRSLACKWVGFDPLYNKRLSNSLGGASLMLHVRADCS